MHAHRLTSFFFVFLVLMALIFGGAAQAVQASRPLQPAGQDTIAPALPEGTEAVDGVTFRTRFNVVDDAYIRQAAPDTNYGASTSLIAAYKVDPTLLRYTSSLLMFNLSSLPANAVVDSATLSLNVTSAVGTTQVSISSADSAWVEETVTWNSSTSATSRGDANVTCPASGWMNLNVNNTVAGWVAGDYANNGFRLSTSVLGGSCTWSSKEAGISTWPYLTVEWHTEGSPMLLPVQKDTYVNSLAAGTNYGSASALRVYRASILPDSAQEWTLVDFDLSGLPADVQIDSAVLRLYNETNRPAPESADVTFYVQPAALLSAWDEARVTWTNKPAVSNRGDAAAAYLPTGWTEISVTEIVRDWADGTLLEYGIALGPGSIAGTAEFYALPAINSAQLEIAYTPICRAISGVTVSGPTAGLTGTEYTFTPVISPANATQPFTYFWRTTDQADSTASSVSYTWATPGTKTIKLDVTNCAGTFSTTLQVVISDPPPVCPVPLTGLVLNGPTAGMTGAPYEFTATAQPANVTTPVSYTWTVTDQADRSVSSGGASNSQSYTWAAAGAKTVTVTAQNCGGTFQASQGISISEPAALPDLQVSSLWYEPTSSTVGYIVQNVGGSTAEAGTITAVYQNNVFRSSSSLNVSVPPGGLRAGAVISSWSCAAPTAEIKVCTDSDGMILEGDEANNCFTDTWVCDIQQPLFTKLPAVEAVGEQTATITLKASEPVSAILRYGYIPGQDTFVTQASLTESHTFLLNGLSQNQPYFFSVDITDASGLSNFSSEYYFTTLPMGSTPPENTGILLARDTTQAFEFFDVSSTYKSWAAVESVGYVLSYNNGTTLVNVNLGASTVKPDFKLKISPAALGLTRAQFYGPIRITAVARTPSNVTSSEFRDFDLVDPGLTGSLKITAPVQDEIVLVPSLPAPAGSKVMVRLQAEKFEWKCVPGGVYTGPALPAGLSAVDCADVSAGVNKIQYYIDDVLKTQALEEDMRLVSLPVSVEGLAGGFHQLKACAFLDDAGVGCGFARFKLVQAPSLMTLVRNVTRHGSYFTIELKVKNISTQTLRLYQLRDQLVHFQGARVESPTTAVLSTETEPGYRLSWSTFKSLTPDWYLVSLNAGQEYSLVYRVSPVMTPDLDLDDFYPGAGPVEVLYTLGSSPDKLAQQLWDNPNQVLVAGTSTVESLSQSVQNALSGSDYVVVTHPINLVAKHGIAETAQVLERMAHFASLRGAVLGFVGAAGEAPSDTAVILDDLVETDGAWALALHPKFSIKYGGYMLLVGGLEIIPAFYAGTSEFTTYPAVPDYVDYSDLRYANTAGNTLRPEIALGRIPWRGASAANGIAALDTNIRLQQGVSGYAYTGVSALTAASNGTGPIEQIQELYFWNELESTRLYLLLTGKIIDTLNMVYTAHIGDDEFAEFIPLAQGKSLVQWNGHGSTSGWKFIQTNTIPQLLEFGSSAPMVFGSSCLTGAYNDGDFASTMISNGAAAYIGSTEISEITTNGVGSPAFAAGWGAGNPVGVALNNAKIIAWDEDGPIYDNGKLWAFEYHLFGDPKLGYPVTFARLAERPEGPDVPQEVSSVVDLSLPMYTVTSSGGLDMANIQGGSYLQNPGQYLVPQYTLTQDYPAGTQIANVTLVKRSDPVPAAGLNLARHFIDYPCEGEDCPEPPPTPPAQAEGWYPALDQPFGWFTERNEDGGVRLSIVVYPFFYQVETHNSLYYQEYQFELELVESKAELAYVTLDQSLYEMGDTLTIDLGISNPSEAADFLVETTVRVSGDTPALGGLPTVVLHQVSGTSSLQQQIDPAALGLPGGWYVVDVRLLDPSGTELDRIVRDFRLGQLAVETTLLSADTLRYSPGTPVSLHMEYRNRGIATSGKAIIEVYDAQGAAVATFEKEITLLPVDAIGTFDVLWDTTGAKGDYTVKAWVYYEAMTTPPQRLSLTDSLKVYLPTVLR
jgi:hypothetical protein